MQSYRARIALITGSGNSVSNSFNKWAPAGVDYAATRIEIEGASPESLIVMGDQVEKEAAKFRGKNYDLVIYSCTSGSCIRGEEYNQKIICGIEEMSGSKGLTTSRAVEEAFKTLGCSNTVVFTPYPNDTNELEKVFLESLGIKVLTIKGAGFHQNHDRYTYADPRFIYRNVKALNMEGADSIFISCMALDTLDLIDIFEKDFHLPVITSRQATFWASLRYCGINDKIKGLGKLLLQ